MRFVRKNLNKSPIIDTVFSVVKLAKKDEVINKDLVVNATIGSLFDEDGHFVAFKSVYKSYDALPTPVKAAYARDFKGNQDFRDTVYQWIVQDKKITVPHIAVATPGGTGAINMALTNLLDPNDTVIIPKIGWESYITMAEHHNFKYAMYPLFKNDQFDLEGFKQTILKVASQQDKVMIILNSPCHNPTGYSLTNNEWKHIFDFINELSKTKKVILLNDIAYIDYAESNGRDFLDLISNISENVLVLAAFSISKSLTAYGLRCGALLAFCKEQTDLYDLELAFEKEARASWSNVPNGAMANFVNLYQNHYEEYLKEKQIYIDLIKQRTQTFLKQAQKYNLPIYPYKEGFFCTLKCDSNTQRDHIHQRLMEHHIYTVVVNEGIRIAFCSVPLRQLENLANKIHNVLQSIE